MPLEINSVVEGTLVAETNKYVMIKIPSSREQLFKLFTIEGLKPFGFDPKSMVYNIPGVPARFQPDRGAHVSIALHKSTKVVCQCGAIVSEEVDEAVQNIVKELPPSMKNIQVTFDKLAMRFLQGQEENDKDVKGVHYVSVPISAQSEQFIQWVRKALGLKPSAGHQYHVSVGVVGPKDGNYKRYRDEYGQALPQDGGYCTPMTHLVKRKRRNEEGVSKEAEEKK